MVGAFFSFQWYDYLKNNGPTEIKSRWLKAQLDSIYYSKDFWLAIGIIVSIVGVILLLIIVFLRKRIAIAVTLIEEGSKYELNTILLV